MVCICYRSKEHSLKVTVSFSWRTTRSLQAESSSLKDQGHTNFRPLGTCPQNLMSPCLTNRTTLEPYIRRRCVIKQWLTIRCKISGRLYLLDGGWMYFLPTVDWLAQNSIVGCHFTVQFKNDIATFFSRKKRLWYMIKAKCERTRYKQLPVHQLFMWIQFHLNWILTCIYITIIYIHLYHISVYLH